MKTYEKPIIELTELCEADSVMLSLSEGKNAKGDALSTGRRNSWGADNWD